MKPTNLELKVIERMLADRQLPSKILPVCPSDFVVVERNFSGVGFFTSFEESNETRLFDSGFSLRWGKVSGRLNSRVDVDFVVYVDDGYITGVEGCTFGKDLWPSSIDTFEISDLPECSEPDCSGDLRA